MEYLTINIDMDQITEEFLLTHKDAKWRLPPLPANIIDTYELARWIFQQNLGWIKLDLEFDVNAWKSDYQNIKEYCQPHRATDSGGWHSCCIHGLGIDKTENAVSYGYEDENNAPYTWTELADSAPTITNFFKNVFPSEHYKRIRIMEIIPGGHIKPHGDIPEEFSLDTDLDPMDFGVPVNIAVIHPDNCVMPFEDKGILPYREGELYIPNVAIKHAFLNYSDQSRIHIIADVIPGNKKHEYAQLVVNSYKKEYDKQVF
jgi:hypothetical protein